MFFIFRIFPPWNINIIIERTVDRRTRETTPATLCHVSHTISATQKLFAYANKWIYDSLIQCVDTAPVTIVRSQNTDILRTSHPLIGISFAPKTEIVIFTCGITWNVKLHLNLIFHVFHFSFVLRSMLRSPHSTRRPILSIYTSTFLEQRSCSTAGVTTGTQKWRLDASMVHETIRLYSYLDSILLLRPTAQSQHSIAA